MVGKMWIPFIGHWGIFLLKAHQTWLAWPHYIMLQPNQINSLSCTAAHVFSWRAHRIFSTSDWLTNTLVLSMLPCCGFRNSEAVEIVFCVTYLVMNFFIFVISKQQNKLNGVHLSSGTSLSFSGQCCTVKSKISRATPNTLFFSRQGRLLVFVDCEHREMSVFSTIQLISIPSLWLKTLEPRCVELVGTWKKVWVTWCSRQPAKSCY